MAEMQGLQALLEAQIELLEFDLPRRELLQLGYPLTLFCGQGRQLNRLATAQQILPVAFTLFSQVLAASLPAQGAELGKRSGRDFALAPTEPQLWTNQGKPQGCSAS